MALRIVGSRSVTSCHKLRLGPISSRRTTRMFTGTMRTGISIVAAGAFLLLGWPANAQQLAPRIAAEINSREWVPLRGSHSPLARPENESGRVSPEARLEGISIVFSRTDAQ